LKDNKTDLDISVRKYISIFNSIPIPAYIWKIQNDEFRLIHYNKAAELITEGKISNFLGTELHDLYDKDSEVFDDIKKCFYQKLDFSKEMLYTYKSTGKKKVLQVSYKYLHPNFVIVYTVDITKQKEVEKTEEKLKQSEEKYRLISENMNDLISVFDTKFKFEYINEKIHTKLMGYTKDDLIGTNGINLIHPDEREFVLQQLTKTIKAGKGYAEARNYSN
jgi:PAS domain-containing protein